MNIETFEIDPSQQSQFIFKTEEIQESEHLTEPRLVEIDGVTYIIQGDIAYIEDQAGTETFTGHCDSISDKNYLLICIYEKGSPKKGAFFISYFDFFSFVNFSVLF